MSDDLEVLGRWAIRSFAAHREEDGRKPLLAVVGGDYDALSTSGDIHVYDDVEQLAWLVGYIGYPCDAIYVVCTWEGVSVERDIDHIKVGEPTELDATTRLAVISWAHCIPTRQSLLLTLSRHFDDDGTVNWYGIVDRVAAEMDTFSPLMAAAHTFDQYAPELAGRQRAMQLIIDDNEQTHDTIFYEPGTLLEAARTVSDKQTGVE